MSPDIDSESRFTYREMDSQNQFTSRHIGPRPHDVERMLASMGLRSLDELIEQTIPEAIRLKVDLDLPEASTEKELLGQLEEIGSSIGCFGRISGWGTTIRSFRASS